MAYCPCLIYMQSQVYVVAVLIGGVNNVFGLLCDPNLRLLCGDPKRADIQDMTHPHCKIMFSFGPLLFTGSGML